MRVIVALESTLVIVACLYAKSISCQGIQDEAIRLIKCFIEQKIPSVFLCASQQHRRDTLLEAFFYAE